MIALKEWTGGSLLIKDSVNSIGWRENGLSDVIRKFVGSLLHSESLLQQTLVSCFALFFVN